MRRRDILGGLLLSLAGPCVAATQEPGRPGRVGYLSVSTPEGVRVLTDAFRGRLRALGWQESNLVIEYRIADGHLGRLPELAADLVRLRVDLIYAPSTPAALAARARHERSAFVSSLSISPGPTMSTAVS